MRYLKKPFLANNTVLIPAGMLSCSISFGLGDVIMVVQYERAADIMCSGDFAQSSIIL
jgi:hypothetical protein